jgi:putative FmdB family regulatory protein
MPVYEYVCKECKNEWEVEQSITDKKITKCPKCEKESAQRLISNGSFQLKGGGWFKSGGY